MKKKISILGSTGSIGKTLIEILKKDKKHFSIELLSTNQNYKELLKQVKFFNVKNIIVTNNKSFLIIKKILKKKKINVYNDFSKINDIFKKKTIDYTMSAITGLDGLDPTLKFIKHTKNIAIANKESIICGWSLISSELKKFKTKFIPIDSEHFSIWSLTDNIDNKNIEKIFITASGGPFLSYPLHKFKSIKKEEALKHPKWKMGKKISIDSATMMNKIFEVIEAKKIFSYDYNKIEIITHPQSYVHAIVKFTNGLTKILTHDTNMTIPIFNSLYPKFKKKIKSKSLDISTLNNLNLKKINHTRYPVVKLLKSLPIKDSLYETVIVAANDELVKMFLDDRIKFTEISKFLLKIANKSIFKKYKQIRPINIKQIKMLSDYVSLKINTMVV
jgi:1-deoxy-D-xylulose-5-phosphate reductoisomerase